MARCPRASALAFCQSSTFHCAVVFRCILPAKYPHPPFLLRLEGAAPGRSGSVPRCNPTHAIVVAECERKIFLPQVPQMFGQQRDDLVSREITMLLGQLMEQLPSRHGAVPPRWTGVPCVMHPTDLSADQGIPFYE
jgi:hypothetical protein